MDSELVADSSISPTTQPAVPGRLTGMVALVTGAGGAIGSRITERYLAEGATVAMVGRNAARLDEARAALLETTGADGDRLACVAGDAGDARAARAIVEAVVARYGRIDVLVNNAGSTGPKQRIEDLPITVADLAVLQARGGADAEAATEAARNLLGVVWNMVRAAAPAMRPGASIINVSTIFSRTRYYGRAAYAVPKAALNALSRRLASELGPRGIRVNTVLPGPIEGDRIRTMFAAMDALRDADAGTTQGEVLGTMTLLRPDADGAASIALPTVDDVVGTIAFLGSRDAAALNGHNFEVTHGMVVRQESRSTLTSRPDLRIVDGDGRRVLVIAGDDVDDAVAFARAHAERGADVLLGCAGDAALAAARRALDGSARDVRIVPLALDRDDSAAVEATLARSAPGLHAAVVLPRYGRTRWAANLIEAGDDDVTAFLQDEVTGALGIARALTRHWKRSGVAAGRVAFVSNADDGSANAYADVLRSAVEQLIRIWRDESELDARLGRRRHADYANQIVRFTNPEPEAQRFAAAWTAKLVWTKRRTKPVNLYLPESLADDTGATRTTFGASEALIGLHLGKVALITGGSGGIGGALARMLAIAGAKVVLVARGADALTAAREEIVHDLEAIGFDDASARVSALDGIDVADDVALGRAMATTLERYGRVDYLINNAGVAGAERMVIDMDVDAWRRTLRANLVSNWSLIARAVPEMKRAGGGYILNVSSYFGGEKSTAVAYPNRADYAVSKAGQRALVETLAGFVGPEIQLNAIAPGPVEGDRLKGAGGKAGLYERRGKLILEGKRANAIYAAAIAAERAGLDVATMMRAAMRNDLAAILADETTAAPLRALAQDIARHAPPNSEGSYYTHLMDERIAETVCSRLRTGGHLAADAPCGIATAPPQPFYLPSEVAREAEKIRSGVLALLHLQRMPTETEVALATVFYLADTAVSGETFQPSGGLRYDRSVTERELFGRAKAERIEQMRGTTVWLVGDESVEGIARAARAYIEECRVERVVLVTSSARVAERVMALLGEHDPTQIGVVITSLADVEAGLAEARERFGRPSAVASFPWGALPTALFDDGPERGIDGPGFEALLEAQLTPHFRVGKVVSLLDDVRLVFVAPDVPLGGNRVQFALARFVQTSLHALTATLGVENERLVHGVPVNQINVTRRSYADEPRNAAEAAEEADRFARALILASGPLPGADDSRYRSRIYRGMAITV